MGGSKHIGNATKWLAVSSAPDFCQVGNSVVPFDSFAIVSNPTLASPNVLAQGVPVYRVGDMHQGVQADAGVGIPSGTSLGGGYVMFLQGETNVHVNGTPVIRHDSQCLVNCNAAGLGGALGRLLTAVAEAWVEFEPPNPALRALLDAEWDPWYKRAFETIDSVLAFDRPEMHREHSGTTRDVFIGFAKGLGNLPSDICNLGILVSKHASFMNAIRQKQLEEAAVNAFQHGDTVSANELANEAAGITSSGYVDPIFELDNDRQRAGAGLSALVPIGTTVKLLAGRVLNVFRGAKTLDAAADLTTLSKEANTAADAASVVNQADLDVIKGGDAASETGKATHATGGTGGTGGGGVHVTRASSPVPESYFNPSRVIDMRKAPASSATNAAGFPRNGPWFWRQMLKESPELVSDANKAAIRAGRSPVVDEVWVTSHPTHQSFVGEKLVHHHIDQGPIACGLPESVHQRWHSALHPDR